MGALDTCPERGLGREVRCLLRSTVVGMEHMRWRRGVDSAFLCPFIRKLSQKRQGCTRISVAKNLHQLRFRSNYSSRATVLTQLSSYKAERSLRARPRATTERSEGVRTTSTPTEPYPAACGGSAPLLTTGRGLGVALTTPPHPNVERAGDHLFADDWSVQSNKEAPSAPAMKKEAALLLRSAGHRCLLLSCEDAQSL
jgi:hypothetical protein